MGGFAWVTLATNDSYSLGALVLAHSLKKVGTSHQLAILITPGVTNAMRDKLSLVFDVVREVNILDSKDEANLRLLKRPELGITFTKLHCWRLTQFDKCVFLDADTLVLQNCDELFEREELSAAPDVGWPDCFNSGVFVYCPSEETYNKLVQFAIDKGSFDGGDQGLLNLYFSDWATKDISRHLPFIYNLCSTACYSYLPAFKQFGFDAKIIHFIGTNKPWLQYFNAETRKVHPSSETKHLEGPLQYWWDIFCSFIHPQLTPDMARSSSDDTHTTMSSCTSQNHDKPQPSSSKIVMWDPWEEYDEKHTQSFFPEVQSFTVIDPDDTTSNYLSQESHIISYNPQIQPHSNLDKFEPQITPIESHNTNAHEHNPSVPIHNPPEKLESHSNLDNIVINISQQSYSFQSSSEPIQDNNLETSFIPNCSSQDSQTKLLICAPNPNVQSDECEAAATVCNEATLHIASHEDKCDGGLAGNFAQLTLGERSNDQRIFDEHLRRQGWEVGNIDYMGRDSFDNIWNKICETLSTEVPVSGSDTTADSKLTEAKTEIKPQSDKSEKDTLTTPTELQCSLPAKTQEKTLPSAIPEECLKPPEGQITESQEIKPSAVEPSKLEPVISTPTPVLSAESKQSPPAVPEPKIAPLPEQTCPKPQQTTSEAAKTEEAVVSVSSQPTEQSKVETSCPKPQTPKTQESTPQELSCPKPPSEATKDEKLTPPQEIFCLKPQKAPTEGIKAEDVTSSQQISCPKPSTAPSEAVRAEELIPPQQISCPKPPTAPTEVVKAEVPHQEISCPKSPQPVEQSKTEKVAPPQEVSCPKAQKSSEEATDVEATPVQESSTKSQQSSAQKTATSPTPPPRKSSKKSKGKK